MPIVADRFVAVLGSGRGSDRPDPPLPSLTCQLRIPWLADGASEELCGLVADGELEEPAHAVGVCITSAQQHRHQLTEIENPALKRVLMALLRRLCDDARQTWQPSADSIWSFCGQSGQQDQLLVVPMRLRSLLGAQQRALTVAIHKDLERVSSNTFTVARLHELAVDSYLGAVCEHMGEIMHTTPALIAAPANRKRSVLQRWQREYETYEAVVAPRERRDFLIVLAGLPARSLAHALQVALSQHPHPRPDYKVDHVRTRRSIYEQSILTELKNDASRRRAVVGSR